MRAPVQVPPLLHEGLRLCWRPLPPAACALITLLLVWCVQAVPSSLRNIYKELRDDCACTVPSHGNLEKVSCLVVG